MPMAQWQCFQQRRAERRNTYIQYVHTCTQHRKALSYARHHLALGRVYLQRDQCKLTTRTLVGTTAASAGRNKLYRKIP